MGLIVLMALIPLCIYRPNNLKPIKIMNTLETPANDAPTEPVTAPDAAPTTNARTSAANAPQPPPDTTATAPTASTPTPLVAGHTEATTQSRDPNWARRLRPSQPLIGLRRVEPCVAEHDLRLDGSLRLTGRRGVVMNIPIELTLPGISTPAFLSLAQQQFETVVQDLLVKPATVAFISHLEDVKTARKAEAGKAKQALAAAQEKADDTARELLTRKGSPL